ncbi:MAG TPA: hypothetical protein VM901_09585 [Bdellovibrionota bacterium]|nr:hypothetical protein [Bdellovibrionota bacterium]
MAKSTPMTLLYRGEYQRVLEAFESRGARRPSRDLAVASVGALSFLGRSEEALALYRNHGTPWPARSRAEALFFLCVNFARAQNWAPAREAFASLRELSREPAHRDSLIRFFYYQAAIFLRSAKSQFLSATVFGRRAFDVAVRHHFLYGKILSADLLGHALIPLDQITEGLKHFRDAEASARAMRASGLSQAIRVSISLYESHYGRRHTAQEMIAELEAQIRTLSLKDSYSLINLHLELARAFTLAGDYRGAEDTLREVFELIYRFNNPRQETIYKLRLAELEYRRGNFHAALERVLDIKRWSGVTKNPSLWAQTLGMEIKVQKSLGLGALAETTQRQLRELGPRFPSRVHQRIVARADGHAATASVSSADRIAALLAPDMDPEQILRSGYHGLLATRLGFEAGCERLLWGLSGDSLTVFAREGVLHIDRVRSQKSRQILEALSRGSLSKADLVRKVWGYEYHPLRHDPVLYAAIAQTRKLLGVAGDWIENHENTYALKSSVLITAHRTRPAPATPRAAAILRTQDADENLNHRQILFLRHLTEGDFVSVQAYQRRYRVARNTATRDLRAMEYRNLLVAVGKGPARRYTRYTKRVSPES